MKRSRVLGIAAALFVVLTPALAQIRVVRANIPFDFTVGTKTMPSGEYLISLNGAGMLRVAQTNGAKVEGIIAAPVTGSENNAPRLLFHRYGDHSFLAEVWVGEMSVSHRLYASPAELELAKAEKQGTTTILAEK
jgi:hypothetical protein